MSLRNILVFLDAATPSEGRLRLATRIAHDHQACLSAAFLQNGKAPGAPHEVAAPWLGLLAGPPIDGSVHTTQSATLAEMAEQDFRDRLGSRQLQGDWHALERPETSVLIALARAADLIIIGQIDPNVRPAPTWRPEDVVVGCGRPVLTVPYVGSFDHVGRRVLIAWDGSREAVRAVNDALPLIKAAEAVTVMTVRVRAKDFEHGRSLMEPIIRHLKRHGIAAQPDEALSTSVSDVLLSRSFELSADLVVAGAYPHAQLRETLFGGVTRELFHHMTLPILMSH